MKTYSPLNIMHSEFKCFPPHFGPVFIFEQDTVAHWQGPLMAPEVLSMKCIRNVE